MSLTYLGIEFKRVLRDFGSLFFVVALPAFMYVIFGTTFDYGANDIGNGNVSMYIMIGMAAYGAVTATTSIGGRAAVERMQGWGRQLGLTPMRDSAYVAIKSILAMGIALVPVLLIYAIGYFTGAKGTTEVWLVSALAVFAGAALFAMFGLAVGLAFRSEGAVGVASGMVVILGFLGNLFVPLSGLMLEIAKWTPLYGLVSLARWPLTEGMALSAEGLPVQEEIWPLVLNLVGWLVIFALATVFLVRKGRSRQ